MNFLEKLDCLMGKLSINKSKLSQISGVPYTTIDGFYKKGYENTKISTIRKIAKALNVSVDYLVDDNISDESYYLPETKIIQFPKRDEADSIADRYRNLDDHGKGAVRAILDFEEASAIADQRQRRPVKPRSDGFVDVKVFDQVSAAGLGNYLDAPVYHMEQYPANEVPEGTEFGVRISGVSMSPKIPDGATAFVQSRSTIEPGKIGIFLVNDESFCKKLVVDRDRREIRLASINPDYKDRVIEDADVFSTMGLVLGWWPHE